MNVRISPQNSDTPLGLAKRNGHDAMYGMMMDVLKDHDTVELALATPAEVACNLHHDPKPFGATAGGGVDCRHDTDQDHRDLHGVDPLCGSARSHSSSSGHATQIAHLHRKDVAESLAHVPDMFHQRFRKEHVRVVVSTRYS